jgi:predicted PurR-regulated permease PerM
VTIGGAYGNILGMIIAIPIVTVLKDMLYAFIELKKPEPIVEEEKTDEDVPFIDEKEKWR